MYTNDDNPLKNDDGTLCLIEHAGQLLQITAGTRFCSCIAVDVNELVKKVICVKSISVDES